MPTTIELTFYALVFAITVGMTLGIASAYRRNSAADVGTMVAANFGVSIPVFVLGLIFIYIFAIVLKDTFFALPPSGRLSPGFRFDSIAEAWGLDDLSGPPRTILDFISNMYTVNGLVTFQFDLFDRFAQTPPAAGHRAGHDSDGDHRPHDPLVPARGSRPGLRPHCTGKGHDAEEGDVPSCAAQCDAARRNRDRPVDWRVAQRRRAH